MPTSGDKVKYIISDSVYAQMCLAHVHGFCYCDSDGFLEKFNEIIEIHDGDELNCHPDTLSHSLNDSETASFQLNSEEFANNDQSQFS